MFCVFFLYTIQILIHRKEISFLYKCLTTHIYKNISMYACVYIGQCSQYDDGCSSNNCRKSTAMSGLRLFHIEWIPRYGCFSDINYPSYVWRISRPPLPISLNPAPHNLSKYSGNEVNLVKLILQVQSFRFPLCHSNNNRTSWQN